MHEIRYYEAADGWRWQLIAANEKLIAESGEAYSTEWNCKRAIDQLRQANLTACPIIKTKAALFRG